MVFMEEIKNNEKKAIEPIDTPSEISMEELMPELRAACERAGWKILTPVQAKAIPYLLAGRDMMVQSRTGSGKTGAYLLPIMQKIDLQQNVAQALVLVPTRELALQVSKEAQMLFGKYRYENSCCLWRSGLQCATGSFSQRCSACCRHAGKNLGPSAEKHSFS